MAYSDRELLARLIECEAGGEGEDGMKAVAGVVMNRVNARGGEYARVGQGSIRNIIRIPSIYFHRTGKWNSMADIHGFSFCLILICID